MKNMTLFLLFFPIIVWSQKREIYLFKETISNKKLVNIVFKLDINGVLTPCYRKDSTIEIDSLEEFSIIWPRIRSSNDTVLNKLFSEPISQLTNYQNIVNKIIDCNSSNNPLTIYVKENNRLTTVILKDFGDCKNQLYLKMTAHLIDIFKNSINILTHFSPG